MGVIALQRALDHERIDTPEDAGDVQAKLNAAESYAMQFLNRNFYASEADLMAEYAILPARHLAATEKRDALLSQAESVADAEYRQVLINAAWQQFKDATAASNAILLGMVITPDIEAAVLMTFGHLFENREDVGAAMAELPKGATHLLWPYRVDLGV